MIVACSVMSSLKVEGAKEEDTEVTENRWAKWKRGGIIGAAALGGGALMAITGGTKLICFDRGNCSSQKQVCIVSETCFE